jgi:5-methyltetrahydrofolate--homocysteine methyltransferase
MLTLYKPDWDAAKQKWLNYWKRRNTGRPLMHLTAKRELTAQQASRADELRSKTIDDKYFDAAKRVARYRHYCETHSFLAESFPHITADFGPGSMAAYLGCNPLFTMKTVWFEPTVNEWDGYKDLTFDPNNEWYQKHIRLFRGLRQGAGDDFLIALPDIMENVDILASMRGAQELLFDMMDEPEEVLRRIHQIDEIYFKYYDSFHEIAQTANGGSCHTLFQIWGEGKTAKLQCDYSALLSPQMFRDFVIPSLRKQAQSLDNVLYHLDGPDAIKHLPALMEINEIDSLQWTSGSYNPDGTHEQWFHIYDLATAAGKALWVQVYTGGADDWLKRIDKLVDKYGTAGLFLYFPEMPLQQAEMILTYAENNWK